jgi:hypothetical protein
LEILMQKLLLAVCLSVLPLTASEVYTFKVLGPETIVGSGGEPLETGWGYSIQNQSSSDWLVTTGLEAGVFSHGTPELLFDFPDIAPGATVTVLYTPGSPATGLYQLVWDSNAPVDFVNSGSFTVDAQWWTGDPLGTGERLATAMSISTPYSNLAATPEPATMRILALSLLLLSGAKYLHRRKAT